MDFFILIYINAVSFAIKNIVRHNRMRHQYSMNNLQIFDVYLSAKP